MGKISGVPKTVRNWLEKHHDLFVDAIYETGYIDGAAYDILLSRGHCAYNDAGCHTIIEYTAQNTLDALREVGLCECSDCITGKGW